MNIELAKKVLKTLEMYRTQYTNETTLEVNVSTEGETLEEKIERVTNNGEPITDGAPMIYTERKQGVLPEYDPRTDRFEIAIDAMDKVTSSRIAKREENIITMKDQNGENGGQNSTENGGQNG